MFPVLKVPRRRLIVLLLEVRRDVDASRREKVKLQAVDFVMSRGEK